MRNRAFFFHILTSITRLGQYSTGHSQWDTWTHDELEDKNESIHEKLATGKVIAWLLLIMGLILDLLSLKWRSLARCFFHLEMLQVCLVKMIPVNDVGLRSNSYLYSVLFFDPLCYALLFICDLRVGLVTLVATQAFGNIFLSDLWMTEDAQTTFLLPGVMLLLLALLFIVLFSCLLAYIADLHTALHCKTEEQSSLLGKMQEGVIILEKSPCASNEHNVKYGIKFSNKSADNLFVHVKHNKASDKEADTSKNVPIITTAILEKA